MSLSRGGASSSGLNPSCFPLRGVVSKFVVGGTSGLITTIPGSADGSTGASPVVTDSGAVAAGAVAVANEGYDALPFRANNDEPPRGCRTGFSFTTVSSIAFGAPISLRPVSFWWRYRASSRSLQEQPSGVPRVTHTQKSSQQNEPVLRYLIREVNFTILLTQPMVNRCKHL